MPRANLSIWRHTGLPPKIPSMTLLGQKFTRAKSLQHRATAASSSLTQTWPISPSRTGESTTAKSSACIGIWSPKTASVHPAGTAPSGSGRLIVLSLSSHSPHTAALIPPPSRPIPPTFSPASPPTPTFVSSISALPPPPPTTSLSRSRFMPPPPRRFPVNRACPLQPVLHLKP